MKPHRDVHKRQTPARVGLPVVLYGLSFLLPFVDGAYGWQLFVAGAVYFWTPAGWPWLANPLVWAALYVAEEHPDGSLQLSGLALVLGLSFLLFSLPNVRGFPPCPAYWCWVGSMALLVLGNARELFLAQRRLPESVAALPRQHPSEPSTAITERPDETRA